MHQGAPALVPMHERTLVAARGRRPHAVGLSSVSGRPPEDVGEVGGSAPPARGALQAIAGRPGDVSERVAGLLAARRAKTDMPGVPDRAVL
jgi:hypothetical protein